MKKLKKKRKLRYQAGGPIITNDPDDHRLRAYNDSMNTFKNAYYNDYLLGHQKGAKLAAKSNSWDYNELVAAGKKAGLETDRVDPGMQKSYGYLTQIPVPSGERYDALLKRNVRNFEFKKIKGRVYEDMIANPDDEYSYFNQPIGYNIYNFPEAQMDYGTGEYNKSRQSTTVNGKITKDSGWKVDKDTRKKDTWDLSTRGFGMPVYKKPVQPVVYQPSDQKHQQKLIKSASKPKSVPTPVKTREAIPQFGEEQRPYDSIMMPSGQKITKDEFIKQYGMKTWNKKYGKKQAGGPAAGLKQAVARSRAAGYLDPLDPSTHNYQPAPGTADYFPIESFILPGTPAIKGLGKLGNMALDAANPLAGVGKSGVKQPIQTLEGQAAQNYLNSQVINRSGNPIGTKADIEQLGPTALGRFRNRGAASSDLTQNMLPETDWYPLDINKTLKPGNKPGPTGFEQASGSTDIPANKRLAQMMINKQYKPGPVDTRKVLSRTTNYMERGMGPRQAADPSNYQTSWDWNISPTEISKAKGEPRIEYPLDYHQKNQMGGPITHPMGQLKYPGQVTRIPSNNISMTGVNYPVLGVDNLSNQKMMQPGGSYKFPGTSVTEYPMVQYGGDSTKTRKYGDPIPLPNEKIVPSPYLRNDQILHQIDSVLNQPSSPNPGQSDPGYRDYMNKSMKRYFDRDSMFQIYRNFQQEYPEYDPCKKGNCKPNAKYGGSSDDCFPDDISFPEQRKDDFLKFLRETSFDKVKDQISSEHDQFTKEFKKGGGFKLNPKHTGWCTPMSKSTCTGKRRQFAINAKNHFKKQQAGGSYKPWWDYIPNTGQKSTYEPYQAPQPQQPQQYSTDPNQVPPPVTQPMDPGMQIPMNTDSQMTYNWSTPGKMNRPNIEDRWWANPDLINAGLEGVTSIFNMFDRQKKEKELRKRTSADQLFSASAGSRGDYTTNNGYFRPDQMTPVQFAGAAGFRHYKEGGEYEADESEIQDLISKGYKISYID